MAPLVSAEAEIFSRSPSVSKCRTAVPAGKHPPIHRVGQGLLLGKAEAGTRRGQRKRLLLWQRRNNGEEDTGE